MSTRSNIGILLPKRSDDRRTLRYVYAHSDGYIGWTGLMLRSFYNTPYDPTKEQVEQPAQSAARLVALGDLSAVYPRLEPDYDNYESHSFEDRVWGDWELQKKWLEDLFKATVEKKDFPAALDSVEPIPYKKRGITVAYHRDRGEKLEIGIARFDADAPDLISDALQHLHEQVFGYLFDAETNVWWVIDNEGKISTLDDALLDDALNSKKGFWY